MGKGRGKQRKQIILPPELPPEIADDEIEVSDEDLQFLDENKDYAGFVSRLDTHSINKSNSSLFPQFSNSTSVFSYKNKIICYLSI